MPVSISGTNGVTFPDSSLQAAAASPYVLKNRIINGDMVIDQRSAGASATNGVTFISYGPCDRWGYAATQASKYTAQQNAGSVTPPAGFTNYLGITSLSAYSIATGDYFGIAQRIEGYNTADLAWGTANAKTITISFWVRSSLTGTFGGALQNSAQTRSYSFTYSISSANTWTQISVTISGDTTGTWVTDNGYGIGLYFGLGMGSTFSTTAGSWTAGNYIGATGATSVVGTNGATWYITGVQLEQNTSATPFERRMITNEIQLCQRYYYKSPNYFMWAITGTLYGGFQFKVSMRATPSVTLTPSTGSLSDIQTNSEGIYCNSSGTAAINVIASAEL